MKIALSSDWHGDAVTAGVRRYPEISDAVDMSVETAIEEEVCAYIMAGDLTDPDTSRSHRAVAKAVETDARLQQEGIERIWITGNHDVIDDGSGDHTMLALEAAGANVIDLPAFIEFDQFNFLALPYVAVSRSYDPEQFVWQASKLRRKMSAERSALPTLVVGHLNLEGITPGSETSDMARGRDVFWPIDALKEHFPDAHLFGGHYHDRQVYKGVQIIGSLARLTFGDQDHKPGFLVAEFDS